VIAFKNVDEILAKAVAWEQKLKDFYDVAEVAMQNQESRKTVALLRDKLVEKLEVLRNVDPAKYGTSEWVRYAADHNVADFDPAEMIGRNSSPQEVFSHIVAYQKRIQEFYTRIADKLVGRNQKELFESLAAFKSEQIEELGRVMRQNG